MYHCCSNQTKRKIRSGKMEGERNQWKRRREEKVTVSSISVSLSAAVALLRPPLMLICTSITRKSRDSQGRAGGEHWFQELTLNSAHRTVGNITSLHNFRLLQHGCETWSLTLKQEHRHKVFQTRMLRRIFGDKRDEVTGDRLKLHDEQLQFLTLENIWKRVIFSMRGRNE